MPNVKDAQSAITAAIKAQSLHFKAEKKYERAFEKAEDVIEALLEPVEDEMLKLNHRLANIGKKHKEAPPLLKRNAMLDKERGKLEALYDRLYAACD